MKVSKQALKQLNYAIEALAEELCDEHMMSGEAFYTLMNCYSEAKLAEVQGELASNF